MSNKETENTYDEFKIENTNFREINISKEMSKSYMAYSYAVIVGRALPDVRDGLKPVHRRIIYKMHEMNLTAERPYRKCADIIGNVLGSYHPHGDSSVYDALVRMAQDFSLRHPLIDGQGNFGSIDGDPAAAYRYTEARMAKLTATLVSDIDKDTIDTKENYDGRLHEPKVLPARFPNLLVSGSYGIAVGMATNIPPHNLKESVDAANYLLENPDAEINEIMQFLKGPDFPTGGLIMGRKGISDVYRTGRGRITIRSKATVEEHKGKNRIVVTEIPYQVNKSKLLENIGYLVNEKRIEGITHIQDDSSQRVGLKIVIELRKDANPDVVLNKLYKQSQLQINFGAIMLALVDEKRPKIMNIKEILNHYNDFQKEIIIKRTNFLLKKVRDRGHILEGLVTALDFIDEVIAIIRSSKDDSESKPRLMERFNLDDIQVSAIVAMRLGRLSGLEREKIKSELEEIKLQIEDYLDILAKEERVIKIIIDESTEISTRYADDRRTEILASSGDVDIEDLITEEESVITLTHYGYLKRQPASTYKSQKRGGRGISGMTTREDDFVEELFTCSTHDNILYFTNKGKIFHTKCYEIPEASRISRGTNVANLLEFEEGEEIRAMIPVSEFKEGYFVTMVTKNGIVKRTSLSFFEKIRRSGIYAITLDEDDDLSFVRLTNGKDILIVGTRNGMAIKFKESDVRPTGRTSRGVKAITLGDDDYVVGLSRQREGATLLTVTTKGLGRRSDFSDYRVQNRGGKGLINYKISQNRGHVSGIKTVTEEDDAIMIADNGVIIRMPISQISLYSRTAFGVKVMSVDNGAELVTFARTPREEEEEEMSDEANMKQDDVAIIQEEPIEEEKIDN